MVSTSRPHFANKKIWKYLNSYNHNFCLNAHNNTWEKTRILVKTELSTINRRYFSSALRQTLFVSTYFTEVLLLETFVTHYKFLMNCYCK